MKVLFIRHGETEGNREKRYIGRTDEPLSERGREKLSERKRSGYYPEVSAVYVSPMRRCLETAAVLYPGKPQIPVEDMREMDFGVFEGKNYRELAEDARYRRWVESSCEEKIPQGESRAEFEERCARAFERLLEIWSETKEETYAMIVHGGTIMALLHRFERLQKEFYAYRCENGEKITCEVKKEEGRYYLEICTKAGRPV